MDEDDLDYFPRRSNRRDVDRGEYTKHQNLERMRRDGMFFHEVDKGDTCVFRSSGKPTVRFYTRKNRWQVNGQTKTKHGTIDQFQAFLRELWAEPTTRVDLPGVTSKNQAAEQALASMRKSLGVTLNGPPMSDLVPNDLHVFDKDGRDLGRANAIIKGVVFQRGELVSTALQRALAPGQSLRIVYDRD